MGAAPRRANLLALLVLLCPAALLVGLPLLRGQTFYHEDIRFYFHPLRSLLARPLTGWNPWTSTGLPLLGDPQSAAFSPLELWYRFLPAEVALPLSVLLCLALGSVLAFGFLRHLGLGPWASCLGALVWLWSGFFWNHLHHLTFLPVGIWYPALLWALDHARGKGPRALLPASLVVAMMLLAGGSPQLALYGIYLGVGWWVVGQVAHAREGGARGVRAGGLALLQMVGVVAVGAALSAPVWWPAWLASAERFLEPTEGYERSTQFSLALPMLGRMIVPQLMGNPFWGQGYEGFTAFWEEAPSVGLVTLPLLVVGAREGGLGWRGRFFWWLAVGSLLATLGTLGLVHPILYHVLPGYGLVRAPNRMHVLFTLAAAVLAAAGARALERGEGEIPTLARRASRFVAVLGAEVWLLCALYLGMRQGSPPWVAWAGWALAGVVLLATALWLLRVSRGGHRGAVAIALLLLVVELAPNAWLFNRPVDRGRVSQLTPAQDFLLRDPPDGRVMVDNTVDPEWLNAGMLYGFEGVRGYNPMNSRRIASLMAVADGREPSNQHDGISLGVDEVTSPVLDLVGAAVLVSAERQEALPEHLVELFWDPVLGVGVYSNPYAFPRVFFPGPVQVVGEEEPRARAIRDATTQRPVPLILADPPQVPVVGDGSVGVGRLLDVERSADRWQLRVWAQRPGFVALSEVWAPGWRAWVDGVEMPIEPAWGALRAIWLPRAGQLQVEMRYETPGVREALKVYAAGWLLVALVALWPRRRAQPS